MRLIESLPEWERERSSPFADEGSAAHALAEECLRFGLGTADFQGAWLAEQEDGSWSSVRTLPTQGAFYEFHPEMAEAVDVYLAEVRRALSEHPGAQLWIEERVAPLDSRPEETGTADAILFDARTRTLLVFDYKHGAGVPVDAKENAQEIYYALGALRRLGTDAVDQVILVVIQPRARHAQGPVRHWETTVPELLAWRDRLEAAAAATDAPDAPLRAGEWCRFCKAQASCPALKGHVAASVQVDFESLPAPTEAREFPKLPVVHDPAWLGRALTAVPVIESWCAEVRGAAQRMLEHGAEVPGFKLVRGRANRRWLDPEMVEQILRGKRGVKRADVYEIKLRSPAQLERVPAIGRTWVERYAIKPEGALGIAPESDPRPTVRSSAEADFEDLSFLE